MPRSCTVCAHPESFAINEALVLEKQSNRSKAKQFGLDHNAVQRHRRHIPELLVKSLEAEEAAQADELLGDVRSLQARTLAILEAAEDSGEHRTALAAIREARNNLELLGRLAGELQEGTTVNLYLSPQWFELRTVIVTALEPYSEARGAVLRALEGAGNGRAG